jgi:hypothetical protein
MAKSGEAGHRGVGPAQHFKDFVGVGIALKAKIR